jgi:hypothetical protein
MAILAASLRSSTRPLQSELASRVGFDNLKLLVSTQPQVTDKLTGLLKSYCKFVFGAGIVGAGGGSIAGIIDVLAFNEKYSVRNVKALGRIADVTAYGFAVGVSVATFPISLPIIKHLNKSSESDYYKQW